MNNWCEECDEECHDHSTVCTVCGTTLAAPPIATTTSSSPPSVIMEGQHNATDAALLHMQQAGRDLREVLGSLRGQVQDLEALTRNILEHQQRNWQDTIPPELWDPQNTGTTSSNARPTSEKALQQIPRIVLEEKSTIFRQGTLQIFSLPTGSRVYNDERSSTHSQLRCSALIGEFGPIGEHHFQTAALVVASPLTGKGGLSEETINSINLQVVEKNATPVVFMQRGDGLTFVQKAMMAQKAGAAAVIMGNNTASPWPYVMKDSNNEAETHRLSIPVVMVKEADAHAILQLHKKKTDRTTLCCDLHITAQSHDCVVCCERLQTSETVVQLPGCAHIFHESCAMSWLKSHNTCPYCRRELPTDDEEYERERRRQQRTHAGQSSSMDPPGNERTGTWSEYYG
ncbi:ring finger domain containing protein [Nitzschia inconspicua]|uniref:Ring finger domain containing protein n=1 Tax=Nitzschia inconspicua TaxID=303405 RepID=A0A9K3L751_9STRA|nr:ring finger domain containing protein [Nitzschia inconspicua]